MLTIGDLVPNFYVKSAANPRFSFGSTAGRNIAVTFLHSTRIDGVEAFYERMHAEIGPFDDSLACSFLVFTDPQEEVNSKLQQRMPGLRIFLDTDLVMSRTFGSLRKDPQGREGLLAATWILDPGLRVVDILPVRNMATHFDEICAAVSKLQHPQELASSWAPVLAVPRVLEPEFCRELVDYWASQETRESGYMKTDPATGETVLIVDHGHKRRRDCTIEDPVLRDKLQARIHRRLVPQIERAFQFKATRIERYMIACYDSETGGYFRPHKDNTTLGTAHRRFAVSIGLEADSYEGGDLRFPEFGPRTYRPETGGAIVFSCSLLHEALPVTRGRRLVVLPFLYDEAAAKIRRENAAHIQDEGLRNSVLESIVPLTE